MKMKLKRIIIFLVTATIAVTLIFSGCTGEENQVEKVSATLIIDFNGPEGSINPGNITVWRTSMSYPDQWQIAEVHENNGRTVWIFENITGITNVLELLERAAEIGEFAVNGRRYQLPEGYFIEAIDGVQNENPGRGWQYYVNGEYALKACDKYNLSDGDVVLWLFKEMNSGW